MSRFIWPPGLGSGASILQLLLGAALGENAAMESGTRIARALRCVGALCVGIGCLACEPSEVDPGTLLDPPANLDLQSPLVTITRPANNAVLRPGPIRLEGTASDETDLVRVEVEIQGNTPQDATGLTDWTYETPVLASGNYVIIARAFDAFGNVGETQVRVILQTGAGDTEAPEVTMVEPDVGATLGPGPFWVRGTATDEVAVDEVFARLGGGAPVVADGTNTWSVQLDASGLASGNYQLVVGARDGAGNEAVEVSRPVVVDAALPYVTVVSGPMDPTNSSEATFTLAGPNVVTYRYVLDGGAPVGPFPVATPIALTGLADGLRRIELTGLDGASTEQATPTVFEWRIDTTPPIATVSAPPSPTQQDTISLTVGGTDVVTYRYALDGGAYSVDTDVNLRIEEAGLAEGPRTVRVLGSDVLGNEQGTPTLVNWVIDQTPPDPGITTVTGAPQSVTVGNTTNITVGGTGVVNYYYELDGGPRQGPFPVDTPLVVSGLTPGGHTLEIFGEDAAGNVQVLPNVVTWTIDPDSIVAVVSAPPAITNQDLVTLTVSGAGVVEYEYILTPPTGMPGARLGPIAIATPITIDTTLTTPSEGTYLVQVFGVDGSGGAQPVSTDVSFEVDRTPPTAVLSNTPPADTDQTFLNVSVGGQDVVAYRYRLDGGPLQGPFPVATRIEAIGLQDGAHTLEVFGRDTAGNEQPIATELSWTITTVGPTAALSGVPPSVTSATDATITVSGDDVVEYEYRLDGGTLEGPFPVATAITLTGLATGAHTLEVFGIDSMANRQTNPTVATWTVEP